MSAASVIVTAPAKVNLYLAVSGLRPDGYHSVSTVLQALELADELLVSRASGLTLSCDPPLDIPAEENLVYRAALAFGEVFDVEPAFAFALTKRIPSGAGLGGGSSDAAAALAGMAALSGVAPDDYRLARIAAGLGADVPFFLGGGAALYGGRGDDLLRVLPAIPAHIALVKPADPVPTAAAYAAFDRSPICGAPGSRHVADALRSQSAAALAAALFNNMTDAACGLVADIADALALCRTSPGVMGAALCGSGSAVFALCDSRDAAYGVADAARGRGWWSAATRTSATGVVVRTEGNV